MLAASASAGAQQQAGQAEKVTVSKPWARATPGGAKVAAAYLEISPPKGTADKLVAARSPVAGIIELHTHSNDGGVMRMRRVEVIPIEGDRKVTLNPGGHHIMLMELKKPLKEGDTFDMTLVFEKSGEVAVKVPILKVGSPGPGGTAGSGSSGHGHQAGHGRH